MLSPSSPHCSPGTPLNIRQQAINEAAITTDRCRKPCSPFSPHVPIRKDSPMSLLSADLGVRKGKQKIIYLIPKLKSAEHPKAPREEIPGKVMSIVSSAWQYSHSWQDFQGAQHQSYRVKSETLTGFINPTLTHAHCNLWTWYINGWAQHH